MSKSTKSSPTPKDFPLWVHGASGRWCRKVRGVRRYFGSVKSDPTGAKALEEWLRVKDDLLAGRTPRKVGSKLTVSDLCNLYLEAKDVQRKSGELSARTFADYTAVCKFILNTVDRNLVASELTPADFAKIREAMTQRWGATRVGNVVQMVRGVFSWGKQERLIPDPVYGASFHRPATKSVRAARNAAGPRMMTPADIHKLIGAGDVNIKAAVLLAANGGIGPSDLARLPITALDLDAGWLNYPRHKTAVARKIPLWPETIAAIRAVLAVRPTPKPGHEDYLLLRKRGKGYLTKKGELLGESVAEVAQQVGVDGRLYDLRRGFQTVGERSGDSVAVSHVMGHCPKSGDMSATYRQHIDDDRLVAVTQVVHDWLFSGDGSGDQPRGKQAHQDAPEPRQDATESTPVRLAILDCLSAIEAGDVNATRRLRDLLQGEH